MRPYLGVLPAWISAMTGRHNGSDWEEGKEQGLEGKQILPIALPDKCLHTYTETKYHTRANKFQGKTYQANSPSNKGTQP